MASERQDICGLLKTTKRVSVLSLCCDQRQQTFVNLCHINLSMRKNGNPLKTTNHHIFLTKYSNRLTDQPLCKHYRVKLDLDGLGTPRYLRITKRATKRVSVLSLCCDQRQETFVNLGLFQTTTN